MLFFTTTPLDTNDFEGEENNMNEATFDKHNNSVNNTQKEEKLVDSVSGGENDDENGELEELLNEPEDGVDDVENDSYDDTDDM